MKRSKRAQTPARISVTPASLFEYMSVGLDPTETIWTSNPAALRRPAALTMPARSPSAAASIASIVLHS